MRRPILISMVPLFVLVSMLYAADQNTIKIGVLLPLSGPEAPLGEKFQRAYTMAAEEINDQNEIGNLDLELIFEDTRDKPNLASKAVQRLIKQKEVAAIVGGWSSDVAWAIAQKAQENSTPYLIDHSALDRITRQGYQYVFRLQPTAGMYPAALEDFLSQVVCPSQEEKKKLRVAYMYINNLYGKSTWIYGIKPFFDSHKEDFKLLEIPYQELALDFRVLLLKVRSFHPQIILFTSFIKDAVLLAKEIHSMGLNAQMFSGTGGGHSMPGFIEQTGETGEGYFTSGPWRGDSSNPEMEAWSKRWLEKYGYIPGTEEAEGYSALRVLAEALKKVKNWDNIETARKELQDALKRLQIKTVFGLVKFENFQGYTNQNRGEKLTALYQWQHGKLYQVWPPEVAETLYIYPVINQHEDSTFYEQEH